MTQQKVLILLTAGIVSFCVPNISNAATLNGNSGDYSTLDYIDNNSQTFEDVNSDVDELSGSLEEIDSQFSELEGYYNETVGEISGTVGEVMGWFNRVSSPIADIFQQANEMTDLIVRLINFPSQIGNWWDGLVNAVVGELDPCLSELGSGRTPTFVYESGWCFGSQDTQIANDNGSNSPTQNQESVGKVMAESKGAAGIPIPSKTRLKMQEAIDRSGSNNSFEVSPTVVSLYAGNMVDRSTTRLASESILGEVGQKKMMEEREGLNKAVISSAQIAKGAQGLDVTQDVMKQMVQMQATESLLTGSLAASSQQHRVDSAFANLNLTNISRSLDESNRSRRIDRSLLSNKALQSTASLKLE